MNPVTVRGLRIGEGIPKICVPIVEKTSKEIIEMAKKIVDSPADLVEWRADWFEDVFDYEKTMDVLKELREVLGDVPLLFTFRTMREGGEKEIDAMTYMEINQRILDTGYADLIDVEVLNYESIVKELMDYAHVTPVKIIASHHNFKETPCKKEMVAKLKAMREYNPDILKIAVMPNSQEDVLALLSLDSDSCPLVKIAMSKLGMISRIAGETFGSAITFGTVEKASAPGQISAVELKKILELMHE